MSETQSSSRPGRNIDGIHSAGRRPTITPRPVTPLTAKSVKVATATPAAPVKQRTVSAHAKSHAPQHAQTLMRHTVKKPQKLHAVAHTPSGTTVKSEAQVVPKLSVTALDAERLEHAQSVAKSDQIRRFNPIEPTVPLVANTAPQIASQIPVRPVAQAAAPVQTTGDLLQRVLEQSTSHEQPPVAHKRHKRTKRALSFGTAAAALLLLIGIAGYQNISTVKLHVASARAGFTAGLPANKPAGFGLSSVSASAGVVAASFHSNSSDDRSYTLTEKPSQWDSTTLRDSVVAPIDSQYTAVDTADRTIYLYDSNSATWVNNGIWYTIISNGALTSQQLISIASSL